MHTPTTIISEQKLTYREVKLVIFDWDGTLLDSSPVVVKSHLLALESLGITGHDETSIESILGMDKDAACAYFTEGTSISSCRYYSHFKKNYQAQLGNLTLFAESKKIINTLHAQAISMAVATNKSKETAYLEITNTGLRKYFDHCHHAEQSIAKPHPKMLIDIMSQYNYDRKNVLMIGDQIADIIAAKNANVASITVYKQALPKWAKEHQKDSTFLTHKELLCALGAHEKATSHSD